MVTVCLTVSCTELDCFMQSCRVGFEVNHISVVLCIDLMLCQQKRSEVCELIHGSTE